MKEVQASPDGVAVRSALFEKVRRLPECFPKAQDDLEDMSDFETRQRPLFRGQRGRKSQAPTARLEHGHGQRDDRGTGMQDLERSTIAAEALDAHVTALPRDALRDGAQTELCPFGIQTVAQPLHQRVAAVRNPELLVFPDLLFATIRHLFRKRLGADALGVGGVETLDKALEHGTP